jgi:hypothetical protein
MGKKTPDKTGQQDVNRMLLDMLDSLADALETKADDLVGSGTVDEDSDRVLILKDMAAAIRERFCD